MARQDLENFKYIYFWQTDVALDSTQKQCWGQLPTAITGEQIDLSCRVHSIVALLCVPSRVNRNQDFDDCFKPPALI